MWIDDVQWQFNKTSGLYELYCYGQHAQRVFTLEITPNLLLQVIHRLNDRIHHDFPPTNPPEMRNTGEQTAVINEEKT